MRNSIASSKDPPLLFNPPLLFISKGHGLKAHDIPFINSDPGHTRSKQELDKTLKITFISLSKSTDEKENEKKRERQLQTVMRYTETQ